MAIASASVCHGSATGGIVQGVQRPKLKNEQSLLWWEWGLNGAPQFVDHEKKKKIEKQNSFHLNKMCIFSSYLVNVYPEHTIWKTGFNSD